MCQARSFAIEYGAHGARLREEEEIDHLRAYIAVDRVRCQTKRNCSFAGYHMVKMLSVAETREGQRRASLLLLLHEWGRGLQSALPGNAASTNTLVYLQALHRR